MSFFINDNTYVTLIKRIVYMMNRLIKLSALLILSNFLYVTTYAATPEKTQESTILTWLSALDKKEVSIAKIALKNSNNAEIKKYAEHMVKDHGKNLTEAKHLMQHLALSQQSSASIKELKEKGADEAKQLGQLKDKEFDKAFMEA